MYLYLYIEMLSIVKNAIYNTYFCYLFSFIFIVLPQIRFDYCVCCVVFGSSRLKRKMYFSTILFIFPPQETTLYTLKERLYIIMYIIYYYSTKNVFYDTHKKKKMKIKFGSQADRSAIITL